MKKRLIVKQIQIHSFITDNQALVTHRVRGGTAKSPSLADQAVTLQPDDLGSYCPNPLAGPSGHDTNGDKRSN